MAFGMTITSGGGQGSSEDVSLNIFATPNTPQHSKGLWLKSTNDIIFDHVEITDSIVNDATPIPDGRYSMTAQVVNGKIYCIGGLSGSPATRSKLVSVYNIETKEWTTGSQLPSSNGLEGMSSFVAGDKIYCVGGYDGSSSKNSMLIYDTVSNTWTTGKPCITARYYGTANLVGDKVYCIGGTTSSAASGITSAIDVYDINTDTWSAGASTLLTTRKELTSSVIGNKIYCIGGYSSSMQGATQAYDTVANTWEVLASIPQAKAGMTSQVFENEIYCIGGGRTSSLSSFDNKVNIYNANSNSWGEGETSPFYKSLLSSIKYNDRIYCIGGSDGSAIPVNSVDIYDAPNDTWGFKWSTWLESIPVRVCNFRAHTYNNKIYCLGGEKGLPLNSNGTNLLQIYDIASNTWSNGTVLPNIAYSFTSQIIGDKIYCIGGKRGSAADQAQTQVNVYTISKNSWVIAVNMLSERFDAASAVHGDKIYCMGGSTLSLDESDIVHIYDATANTWSVGKSMSKSLTAGSGCCVGDKIYCIGGYSASSAQQYNQCYDVNLDTWSSKMNMPTARFFFDNGVVGDKIYCLGGEISEGRTNKLEVYNTSTNLWEEKKSLKRAKSRIACSVLNNKIYCIGGYVNATSFSPNIDSYDITENEWGKEALPPSPTIKKNPGMITVNNKIYRIGGEQSGSGYSPTVEIYNPKTNTWSMGVSSPLSKSGFAIASVKNKIYCIAGYTGSGLVSSIEIYDTEANTWSTGMPFSFSKTGVSAVSVGPMIYCMGGSNGNSTENLDILDTEKNQWITGAYMPVNRSYFASSAIDGKIYCFGGQDEGSYTTISLKSTAIYDIGDNSWSVGPNMSIERHSLSSEAVGGKIYIIGGVNSVSPQLCLVEIYDPKTNTIVKNKETSRISSSVQSALYNEKIYCTCELNTVLAEFNLPIHNFNDNSIVIEETNKLNAEIFGYENLDTSGNNLNINCVGVREAYHYNQKELNSCDTFVSTGQQWEPI